jgi:hypothetical protein
VIVFDFVAAAAGGSYLISEDFEGAGTCVPPSLLGSVTEGGACPSDALCVASLTCRFDADLSRHVHVVHPEGTILDVPADLGDPLLTSIDQDAIAEVERRMGVKVVGVAVHLVTAKAD